ncbi:tyrosine-type recombinase/integrase [Sulfitobacter aestuariivivens]|uniref:Tyrosine-type recombinase/integrase n=1 Tax=Sulfitobacter aestuariivivens TaxID=2766981 RepID=A0A927D295_9RHOB|nr:tyrosine-type recombinase/integrase [Sulfitobacter aestuariivivens]MBD3663780.1 tyrosine-type recombinase/integrase [Sulfitobacter aestuariivivens]
MVKKSKQRSAWNRGKIVGPKPALTSRQVTTIRGVLAERALLRDQVMFSLAIDSCLRGADLVRLRVTDVMVSGELCDKVRVQPTKTKARAQASIVFEPCRDTKKLLWRHIEAEDLMSTDWLFTSSRPGSGPEKQISDRAYLNLVKKWIGYAGLSPEIYGTHSIRRSRPAYLYRKTGNLRACQIMLGHKSLSSTQLYLGVEEEETLSLARQFEL